MYNILTDEEVSHLFALFKDRQNTFIQKVVKALPDLIYVMNLDTHVVIYSSRLIALEIGYSAQEVDDMAHPILDIMHPADLARFLKHLQDVKNSKPSEVLTIEFRLIKRNDKIAWFTDRNTIFTRNINGAAVTKIGITHEITERKEHEELRLKHETIIGQSEILAGTGSWAYDSSSGSFTWSAGMYRLFNLPIDSHVQPSVYRDYCTEKDLGIAERVVQGIEEQSSFEETLHITVDGHIRTLKITADTVLDNTSQCKQIIGVDLDITAVEENEKRLIELNSELEMRNREIRSLHLDLKTFANIAATDYQLSFKNIYTSFETIVTNEAGKLSNSGKATIRKVQGSMQRLNLITEDVLSYLNLSTERMSKDIVCLTELVDEVIDDLDDQITNDNIIINRSELGRVKGDAHLLRLLFRHLIYNAIKFRAENRQTIINIRSLYSKNLIIEQTTPPSSGLFAVSIEDNGLGFDESESEKIFELFHKNHHEVKRRGSGVGLAVAKKIMSLHDGFIIGEGKANEGSTFTCFFPA